MKTKQCKIIRFLLLTSGVCAICFIITYSMALSVIAGYCATLCVVFATLALMLTRIWSYDNYISRRNNKKEFKNMMQDFEDDENFFNGRN